MNQRDLDLCSLLNYARNLPSANGPADLIAMFLIAASGISWGEANFTLREARELFNHTVSGAYSELDELDKEASPPS